MGFDSQNCQTSSATKGKQVSEPYSATSRYHLNQNQLHDVSYSQEVISEFLSQGDDSQTFVSQENDFEKFKTSKSQCMSGNGLGFTPDVLTQVTSSSTAPRRGAKLSQKIPSSQEGSIDFLAIASLLKISSLRPFQRAAIDLLVNASHHDTKLIQAPTSMGKDLLPFALAVHTRKVQLVFVPYVALISMLVSEGKKYGRRVVKFTDIGKSTTIQTAAATADVIVLSYEHAPRAIRLGQELESRRRLGWCFFNEAHVAVVDADFRDFHGIQEMARYCPQVCCMTATLQPHFTSAVASILGRPQFSRSILLSPRRNSVSLVIKVTSDPRRFIADDLCGQDENRRAIVFCLFKRNVEDMARILRSRVNRQVFDCTSGATADLSAFAEYDSSVMVCTTVLAAGVSFDSVTRIYFLDGAHGPEIILQGAGRGARAKGETCVATLVTSNHQLECLKERDGCLGAMASFCQTCIHDKLDFAEELYRLFEHPKEGAVQKMLVPEELNESNPLLKVKNHRRHDNEQTDHVKRRLFQSPTLGPMQQDHRSVLCHSGEDQQHETESVSFETSDRVPREGLMEDSVPGCLEDGLKNGKSVRRSQASMHTQLQRSQERVSTQLQRSQERVSSQRRLPQQFGASVTTDFGRLARTIMASRMQLTVPDFIGRCEGGCCRCIFAY